MSKLITANVNYGFYLTIVILASLFFKLYTVDFSLPVNSDNLSYTLHAISISHGNFAQNPQRGAGWPLFASIFLTPVSSDNLVDYSVIIRGLTLGISSFTIIAVYLLGTKFFNKKYAFIMACLFAFEPHLNFQSSLGLSEPLFHLVMISGFYFLLSNKNKFFFVSFLLAGLTWWIRLNGFMVFIAFSLIYLINFRKSSNYLRNYGVCVAIFLLVMSPMLIQRYEQFGNPVYVWYADKIFAGTYLASLSENAENQNGGAVGYIEKNGINAFVQNFIIKGMHNILLTVAKLTFPYLFVLVIPGMILSFKKHDENKKELIRANWIMILITISVLIIPFAVVAEKRFVYYLLPFLIIFAVISINRVVGYGIKKWSLTSSRANVFLIIFISVVVLSSGFYVSKYGKPDSILENEKIKFANYVFENLNGKMLNDPSPVFEYFNYVKVNKLHVIKNIGITNKQDSDTFLNSIDNNVSRLYVNGTTLHEVISNGEKYELKYIVSSDQNVFYPFLDNVHANERNFPYLIKIFDSTTSGFSKLKVKVFEIDYQQFYSKND